MKVRKSSIIVFSLSYRCLNDDQSNLCFCFVLFLRTILTIFLYHAMPYVPHTNHYTIPGEITQLAVTPSGSHVLFVDNNDNHDVYMMDFQLLQSRRQWERKSDETGNVSMLSKGDNASPQTHDSIKSMISKISIQGVTGSGREKKSFTLSKDGSMLLAVQCTTINVLLWTSLDDDGNAGRHSGIFVVSKTIVGHTASINSIAIRSDNQYIATASDDHTVKVRMLPFSFSFSRWLMTVLTSLFSPPPPPSSLLLLLYHHRCGKWMPTPDRSA